MRLTKHHGLGNDFLVLADPNGIRPITTDLARAVCDRNRGIGADGLLRLSPGRDAADVSMTLLNADGGRAEMSGNGIGCLVQAAVLSGLALPPRVRVATDAGIRTVDVMPAESPRSHQVTVEMGTPLLDEEEPEWAGGQVLRAVPVSMGNPHLVLHAAEADLVADREWVADVGRRANAAIAGGVNVEVIAVGERDELVMDVYERGVGLTLACGTGACAAAAAGKKWELVGDRVTVRMVGGPAMVDLSGSAARLTTPIEYVGAVDVPWP
ncbi:MAG: diaminopimelate epimerase [Acidimicrobiales bacterium]